MLLAGKSNEKKEFINKPAHRPERDEEKIRIYNENGEIRETSDGLSRVFLRARMYPGLKISRTIGDLIPHQIGVISEPSFVAHSISQAYDKFFILASDGLWDYFGSEEVIDMINNMNSGQRAHG